MVLKKAFKTTLETALFCITEQLGPAVPLLTAHAGLPFESCLSFPIDMRLSYCFPFKAVLRAICPYIFLFKKVFKKALNKALKTGRNPFKKKLFKKDRNPLKKALKSLKRSTQKGNP